MRLSPFRRWTAAPLNGAVKKVYRTCGNSFSKCVYVFP